jgi:hypothetical protein
VSSIRANVEHNGVEHLVTTSHEDAVWVALLYSYLHIDQASCFRNQGYTCLVRVITFC